MIKLYALTDGKFAEIKLSGNVIYITSLFLTGPPSVSVRILLEYLNIPHEFIYVKYYEGETLGDAFGKVKDAYNV